MDLEFLEQGDATGFFTRSYLEMTGDDAPASLRDFNFAYQAGVRAKVDCVRYLQGRAESADDARRAPGDRVFAPACRRRPADPGRWRSGYR